MSFIPTEGMFSCIFCMYIMYVYLSILLLCYCSASYAGKKDYLAAAGDAKECIRLDPTFVKGYYRLATAQIELKDWQGATATIKQGLAVDENNPQLHKQLKTVKQAIKAEAAVTSAKAPPPPRANLDATVSKELQELQQQYVQLNREHNVVKANILKCQREYKTDEITMSELEKLPIEDESNMYRSIGKIYLLSTRDDVMEHLQNNMETEKKREQDLEQKLEYLERRMQSQKSNMEELLRSNASAE